MKFGDETEKLLRFVRNLIIASISKAMLKLIASHAFRSYNLIGRIRFECTVK